MKLRFPRRAVVLLLSLVLTMSFMTVPAAAAVTISLNKETLELTVGQDAMITATVATEDGDGEVTLSYEVTGDNGVIEVTQGDDGKTWTVFAKQAGVASVVVTDVGQSAQDACIVTVSAAPTPQPVLVTGVALNQSSLTMEVGDQETLAATVAPNDADDKTVTWSSSNSSVASVDQAGKVTAVATGSAVITATTTDGGFKAACGVEVIVPVEKIARISGEPYVSVGGTMYITAWADPAGATVSGAQWSSSNTSVATVQSGGVAGDPTRTIVTGVAPGAATITFTVDGKYTADGRPATFGYDIEVSGLVLDQTSMTLQMGQTKTLVATPYGTAKDQDINWLSSNESYASITGGSSTSTKVIGYNPGRATITASVRGCPTVECAVTVEEDVAGVVDATVKTGMPLNFSDTQIWSDLLARCVSKTQGSLVSVNGIQVPTAQGILYYGYTSPDAPGEGVATSATFYVTPGNNQLSLKDITFVPRSDFTGTAEISYRGLSSNGLTYSGIIRVKVESDGDVSYGTASGRPVTFSAADFTAIWKAKTGKEISYLTFTQPSSNQGVMYYNYSTIGQYSPQVSENSKYYRTNNPYIDNITFVPADDYIGTVKIPYRCYLVGGGSQTGAVSINVYTPAGEGENQITYTVAPGGHVTLQAEKFNTACYNATGANLNYVYFDLPDPNQGALYYNYRSSSNTGSRVSATTRYYRNSSPRLYNISFVADTNASGTARIPFIGYSINGGQFDGELVIRVTDSAGTVRYNTNVGRPVTFNALDFNEACQNANGVPLHYVTFELPYSSVGTLYRNYSNSSSTGTQLKTSNNTNFYYNSSPSISTVTFVPRSSYTGTVAIPFSGYDTAGARFSGEVEITVGVGADSESISYTTVPGGLVNFSAEDFNLASQAITGDNLRYVRFTLPSSRYGKLYYQYNTSRDTGASVSASNSYYRTSGGSRLLDDVSFLAAGGVTGTVVIEYTGMSTANESFTGEVVIAISAARSSTIYYSGSSLPISLRLSDFQGACSSAVGGTLAQISFDTLPASTAGKLYLEYSAPAKPGTPVTVGTNYYADKFPSIGSLTFVPKAEYEGQISIPYTGVDTRGHSYNGTVSIYLAKSYATTSFNDLQGYDWARPSIEYLRRAGISNGYSSGGFGPWRDISRGEFALMVCRAFQLDTGSTTSFPDVPSNSVYAKAVATAKDLGIVQGNNGLYSPTSPITRQSAMTMICRAMQAAGWDMPYASTSVLASYSDGANVSSHARMSVATLVQLGAVKGNAAMQLKPTAAISRAEMAVILHRVLTT